MKILFATSSLFPYRVDWLNELGKYAEMTIYYLIDEDAARNHEWMSKRPETCSYKLMHGKVIPKIGKISFDFIRHLHKFRKQYDVIILDGYGFATQLTNMAYLNAKKYVYYVNIDGAVENEAEMKFISWLKKLIIKPIPYCLSGSKATNRLLIRYGSSNDRIINHPFTSLYKKDIYPCVSTSEEKVTLRQELGITEDKVIISVGRFSYMGGYGKGYDTLLRAAMRLSKDIGWYIIGGKPTEEFERLTDEAKLTNVHYVKFVPKEILKKYYRASDIFALMTVSDVWGLVVNEAMSCGLPVITTYKCVAGLDLVQAGVNGYLVNVGDDRALSEYINEMLSDDEQLCNMAKESLKRINDYTIEKMVEIHLNAFQERLHVKES